MRTSLITCGAVLATAAGAACAQSSVTMYGRVEMQAAYRGDGTSAVASFPALNQRIRLDGLTSRLGFRGVEDLGGGLKAYFNLEHRFKPDTGANTSATIFWEGRSVLGLIGSWGEFYMGRDYVPAFYPGVKVDPFSYNGSVGSIVGQAWAGYTVQNGSRAANAVGYKSPSWNGLSVHVQKSFGEGVVSGTNGANIEYASGPAYLGIGVSDTDSNNRAAIVAAAYDFGFIRPAAWYSVSRHGGNHGRSIALAATAPLGPGTILAVYQVFDPDTKAGNLNVSTGAGGAVRQKVGLGYTYQLSKRTSITPAVAWGEQKHASVSGSKAFDVVLRHDF